jgi:hypothetical protein
LLIDSPDFDLQSKYSDLSKSWEDELRYEQYDNLNGRLAWDVSYGINSYLEMYEVTNDEIYLEKSLPHIEKVFSQRDDNFGRVDYRNESNATWVSEKYTNGRPYSSLVHSGMICFPLIKFADLINNADYLHQKTPSSPINHLQNKTYLEIANFLVAEVEKTVHAHMDQWDAEIGVFRFRNDPNAKKYFGQANQILPLNQQSAMGKTLLYLSKTSNNDDYLHFATQIAKYIKSHLMPGKNYSYYWIYSESNPSVEDISHAAINISFIYECYNEDVVFSESDLIKLSNTLRYSVFEFNKTTRRNVDGTGEKNKYQLQLGRWLNLAEVDPNLSHLVYGVINQYDLNNISGASKGSMMHGLSLLIRYYNTNNKYENYFKVYPVPSNQNLNILFKKKFVSPIKLKIINSNGDTVFVKSLLSTEKDAILKIPITDLAPGIFYLLIYNNENLVQKKIMIDKSLSPSIY